MRTRHTARRRTVAVRVGVKTRLRLLLGDAGLLPEQTQWPVRDPRSGRLVARVDFAWPGARLAVEADGVGPLGLPAAPHRDRARQNDLVRLGWNLLRFTWWDALSAPARGKASTCHFHMAPCPIRPVETGRTSRSHATPAADRRRRPALRVGSRPLGSAARSPVRPTRPRTTGDAAREGPDSRSDPDDYKQRHAVMRGGVRGRTGR
ncbi:hypothetical protein FRACA_3410006 [Frankia canadensis]|uniref:DUF559 domain-containing protein n=1 Tax=Frankia canadensis TaxID=1836972 RepID=A0A2I2KV50_9ACTN|nr:hypothetical protein FRACA_3410006 [Frankia canadensis]SOU56839.1 hypothetical protein FRACA_3410006 [Frankia canadensis]